MNRTRLIILVIVAVTATLLITQSISATSYTETKDGITYYVDNRGNVTQSQTETEIM